MAEVKIYVSKNDKKTKDTQPDLRVALMKENGDRTEFVEIGGLWKSKSGKGYSGKIDLEAKPFQKAPEKKPVSNVDIDLDW